MVGILRVGRLLAGTSLGSTAFTPASLFAASEPGGWYDPSDLTTLFQDAAGTTPVTAVEQPVGLVLDKSKGLVLGSEQIVNGSFGADTDWTKINGATISGGVATLFNAATIPAITQTRGFALGRTYKVSLTWTGTISAGIGAYGSGDIRFLTSSTLGSWTGYVTLSAGTGANFWVSAPANVTSTVDNISVKELPGNHLYQSTSTARPVLSARVNLLTYTEEFDNAYWLKESQNSGSIPTITANAGNSPLGTLTAERIQFSRTGTTSVDRSRVRKNSIATTANTDLKFSIWLKSYSGANQTIEIYMNFGAGALLTATVTNEWQQFSVTANTGAGTSADIIFGLGHGSSTATSSDVLAWGADLRPANAGVGLPAYQRVGAATSGSSTAAGNADYDTTGFPLYLKFDGTDDFLVSGTIDPGSVDKAQVFAGVRKLSDASTQMFCEYSTSVGSNTGSLVLNRGDYANGTGAYWIHGARGAATLASNQFATTPANYAAPITSVLAGYSDISGDLSVIRVNGTEQATATGDKGSGNWGSYPLYIGRRGGTSQPFSGNLYSLILRFSAANLDAATITATETWVNGKTKAYGPVTPNPLIWGSGNTLIWDTGNNITWGNS